MYFAGFSVGSSNRTIVHVWPIDQSRSMKYEDLKMKYNGKRTLIYGFGKSGRAAAEFLSENGALVTIADQKSLVSLPPGVTQVPIKADSLKNQDLFVLSPGIPRNDSFVLQAEAAGLEILSEAELAFREIRTPVIAITGSNGKTTTTTMIGQMLKASGFHVFVGGNIGEPLLHVVTKSEWTAQPLDFVVAELSSYQLETISSLKPRVAVFTNLSSNHLDRYKTLETYARAKHRLREMCTGETTVVLNHQSDWTQNFRLGPAKEVLEFPWARPELLEKNTLTTGPSSVPQDPPFPFNFGVSPFDFSKIQVPGEHNIQNFMAAALACQSVGTKVFAVQRIIDTFRGIDHRIQFLGQLGGISFYNDSKSTTVASTQTCLQAFPNRSVHLLLGGRDKGSDYSPLLDLIKKKCQSVHLYGEAKDKIRSALGSLNHHQPVIPLAVYETLEQATKSALSNGKSKENIVLSPACASQDQFRDFEHRGEVFQDIFRKLEKFE